MNEELMEVTNEFVYNAILVSITGDGTRASYSSKMPVGLVIDGEIRIGKNYKYKIYKSNQFIQKTKSFFDIVITGVED